MNNQPRSPGFQTLALAHLVLQVLDLARIEGAGSQAKVSELDVTGGVNEEVLRDNR